MNTQKIQKQGKGKSFDELTKLYSISKTLRFSLQPIGKTKELLRENGGASIKGKQLHSIIKEDEQRQEDYTFVKKFIDDLHREFLNFALDTKNIPADVEGNFVKELKELSLLWNNKKSNEREIIKQKQKLARLLINLLDNNFISFLTGNKRIEGALAKIKDNDKLLENYKKLKKHNALYAKTESLFTLLELYYLGEKNYDKIKTFDKFHTYFTGFNENRANVYDIKGNDKKGEYWDFISTSIAYRLFSQNIERHFINIDKWNKFKESARKYEKQFKETGWSWETKIKEIERVSGIPIENIFKPKSFHLFFSQPGIDLYNEVLGGIPAETGKEKSQGINEIINLSFQKSGSTDRREFPKMQEFYKQILSDRDKNFIEEFKSKEDVLKGINNFEGEYINDIELIGQTKQGDKSFSFFIKNCQTEQDEIFLSKENIRKISADLTGDFNAILGWHLRSIGDNNYTKEQKRKSITIKELENSLLTKQNILEDSKSEFEEQATFYDAHCKKEWKSKGLDTNNLFLSYFKLKYDDLYEKFKESKEKFSNVKFSSDKDFSIKEKDAIKNYLDRLQDLLRFFKLMHTQRKDVPKDKQHSEYWNTYLSDVIDKISAISNLYNKTRNYITKKNHETEKFTLNFQNPTLADGWSKSKEEANTAVILRKQGMYYLGVMNKEHRNIFKDTDVYSAKQKSQEGKESSNFYEKMEYHLFPDAAKQIPKCSTQLNDVKKHFETEKTDYHLIKNKKGESSSSTLTISKYIYDLNNKVYNEETKKMERKEDGNSKSPKKFQKEYVTQSKDEAGYKKALQDWITFCKEFLRTYPGTDIFEYGTLNNNYKSLDEFYKEVNEASYKVGFTNISQSYIDDKVEAGELYLFQIYNKDFSAYKNKNNKSKDNLHTMYWKNIFTQDNVRSPTIKLNGEAKIFYRKASIKKPFKHQLGDVLMHKSYKEEWKEIIGESNIQEGKDIFSMRLTQKKLSGYSSVKVKNGEVHYNDKVIGKLIVNKDQEIIKDRRYTKDQFLFHCPITLNWQSEGLNSITNKVNKILSGAGKTKIIGIDRGEKHLLYYSVINQQGDILEQGSLNTITSKYENNNRIVEKETHYQEKLHSIENERAHARTTWETIDNIKEMKAGYLSQVVHKLAQLIIKHDAIVVLEDLNVGFKRGRFKIEKQVYQKFEKALIEKLNYLVFKDEEKGKPGHASNAYQLTNKFTTFDKLGAQSGILFYTVASYTSKVDPLTGYIQNLYQQKFDEDSLRGFFGKFESIIWNGDYFEFTYDIKKFSSSYSNKKQQELEDYPEKTIWTVCSCVHRHRYVAIPKERNQEQKGSKNTQQKENKIFDVNEQLKELFTKAELNKDQNLCSDINKQQKEFLAKLFLYFKLILQIRVIDDSKEKGTEENDFILSPVYPFFDSRKIKNKENILSLPDNGDANGAYNIARKGVLILHKIKYRMESKNIFAPIDEKWRWENIRKLESIQDKKECQKLFVSWLKEVQNKNEGKLSNDFFNSKVRAEKLSSAENKFLLFGKNFIVTKREWQDYAQREDVVSNQENKWKQYKK